MRSPLTASLEPLFVRPELRLGRLLVAARAADGQRREDGGLEELAAGRLAFDGVLEPCAGQSAACAATKRKELRWGAGVCVWVRSLSGARGSNSHIAQL